MDTGQEKELQSSQLVCHSVEQTPTNLHKNCFPEKGRGEDSGYFKILN